MSQIKNTEKWPPAHHLTQRLHIDMQRSEIRCMAARVSQVSHYETHQRQRSECGLVSFAHRWLLYELFIKLFMQVLQSYSLRALLITLQ